jgi:CBS domain-containing protein
MATRGTGRISFDEAIDQTVGEVMIKRPKTLPSNARVADVRQAFERSSHRTVLLADGGRFAGAIERDALPADASDAAPASAFVELEPLSVTPDTPMSEAVSLLEGRDEPRLVVLDEDGVTLRGLLCAKDTTGAAGFCVR